MLDVDVKMTGWLGFCVGVAILSIGLTPLIGVLAHYGLI